MIFLSLVLVHTRSTIMELTERQFDAKVVHHSENEIWFVAFIKDDKNVTKESIYRMKNASKIASKMINYASIDTRRYPTVAKNYNLKEFPAFIIFHHDTFYRFNDIPNITNFLKYGMNFISNYCINVTMENVEEIKKQNFAIYFNENNKENLIWNAISGYFLTKPIKICITTDKNVMKALNRKNNNPILMFNGKRYKSYLGKMKFGDIRKEIEKYFQKAFQENELKERNETAFDLSKFNDKCKSGNNICIIAIQKELPTYLKTLSTTSSNKKKFTLLYGENNVPYPFMNQGTFWFYNHKRDCFIKVEKESELELYVDRILDGSAKWTKRINFQKEL